MRPDDPNDINTHTFISPDRVSEYKDDIVADTYFNGNYYFATASQLNAADIYILDVVGLKQLYKNYKGKDILAFYIECDSSICSDRMAKRVDSDEAIMSRLQHDVEAFKGVEELCDFVVKNESQEQANRIVDYIENTFEYYRTRCNND
jgi:guanylate kinase